MASYQETQTNQLSTPPILWHQDNHFVFFKVDIQNVKDEVINISENNFLFKTPQYFIDFELASEINPDESSFVVTEKFVKVSLAKKESVKWTALTKNRTLYKNNIKIDWNSWYDSDADDDEDLPKSRNDFSNVDFASMMQQMQGMGGGGGMESMMQQMQGMEGDGMGDMESMMQQMQEMQQMQGMSEEELAQFQSSIDCENDECEGCDTCVTEEGNDDVDYSDMPELIEDDDTAEEISE